MNLHEKSKKIWAQGHPGTNSKRSNQYPSNAPKFLVKASGPYVWDETGKRYIDFVGALGAIILGHNHPKVAEGVHRQMSTGYISGSLPHPIEIDTAELICEMFPACERVRFFKNGDDATRASVRIARAHTCRDLIVSSGYHGASDMWTSLTPPAIGVVDSFKIVQGDNDTPPAAAHILEPLELDPGEKRRAFAAEVVKRSPQLTIFDEIITGCRVPSYSVHKWWNAKPDMVCLGKAIANGFPLSVVGGRVDVMNCDEYFLSTTFSGEAVSLAACHATLTELRTKNMEDLWFYANRFMDKFNALCKEIGVEIKGYGTRGSMDLTDPKVALFCQEALKSGILFGKAFFFNFSHMESNLDEFLFSIFSDIVDKIRTNKVKLEGPLPSKPFVR